MDERPPYSLSPSQGRLRYAWRRYNHLGSKDSSDIIVNRGEAPHPACLQPWAHCSLTPSRSQSSQTKAPFYNKCVVMSPNDHPTMTPTHSVVWQRVHLPVKVWPLPSAPGKKSELRPSCLIGRLPGGWHCTRYSQDNVWLRASGQPTMSTRPSLSKTSGPKAQVASWLAVLHV